MFGNGLVKLDNSGLELDEMVMGWDNTVRTQIEYGYGWEIGIIKERWIKYLALRSSAPAYLQVIIRL